MNDVLQEWTDEAEQARQQLLSDSRCACLATIGPDGSPMSSYVPYVWFRDRLWIFVSRLAPHFQGLESTPFPSLMILGDEGQNPFARPRLQLHLERVFVSRGVDCWVSVMDEMKRVLGSTVEVLIQLPDFELVELSIVKGRLILGFGKAFEFDGVS